VLRPFRLARLAAEAEAIRLRALASRLLVQVIMGLVGLVFLTGAIVFGHIAFWYWLRVDLGLSAYAAAGIPGGLDLLIAVVLCLLAIRSAPGRTERDALAVRRQAVAGIVSLGSLTNLILSVLRLMADLRRPGQAPD
jgi:hypothetical protein